MVLDPNAVVQVWTRSCPACRSQVRVAVMARDLAGFGPNRRAADCFPYLGSDDWERLDTGRCPEHHDAPLPEPPRHRAPRAPQPASSGYPPPELTVDLPPVPCELQGCEAEATATARVVLGGGLEFLGVCATHRIEIERQEIARRLREAPASSDSWRLVRSENERYVSVPIREAGFSAAEWEVVSHGLVPRVMEDRWFWYADGPTMHGRRSWTGIEVYRFHVVPEGERYVLSRIEILDERDRYPTSEGLSTEAGGRAEADDALRLLRAELLLDAVRRA